MSLLDKPLMLTGEVDTHSAQIEELESENRELREQVQYLETMLQSEKNKSERSVRKLRQHLAPLYQAMQTVFGDMDEISPETGGASVGSGNSKWDAIKQKMPPRHRETIELLLLQGGMKRTQIASALKMDYSNCTKNVIGILLRQGWLVDNGGTISLKQL